MPKASADVSESDQVTIVATVQPTRVIYLNSDNKIIEIATNTTENIAPSVVYAKTPNVPYNLTTDINNQYLYILKNCLSGKYGIVYSGSCNPSYNRVNGLLRFASRISIIVKLL